MPEIETPDIDQPEIDQPEIDQPEIDQQVLPLLPLTTGVVLPGMVVTLTLETDEAHAAAEAAASTDDAMLLLVPKVDGRYARVGTAAKIEELGQTRGGVEGSAWPAPVRLCGCRPTPPRKPSPPLAPVSSPVNTGP